MLVTGAAGLLGTWLRRTTPADVDVVGLMRERPVEGRSVRADLRTPDQVGAVFSAVRPDVVVHAAFAKDAPSIVAATEHVCASAAATGSQVVFVSTDAVFSGDGAPRDEGAEPDPIADYGRWKATAERVVLEADGAVIRLPLLVSLDPADHMLTALRTSAAGGAPATWFTDEIRRPAWASEVGAAIWRIVALPSRDRHGAWHLAGPERLSRYDLAARIVERTGEDLPIAGGTTPVGTNRPRDLELTDTRARRDVDWDPSPI